MIPIKVDINVWILSLKKMLISRHVVFNGNTFINEDELQSPRPFPMVSSQGMIYWIRITNAELYWIRMLLKELHISLPTAPLFSVIITILLLLLLILCFMLALNILKLIFILSVRKLLIGISPFNLLVFIIKLMKSLQRDLVQHGFFQLRDKLILVSLPISL